MSAIPPNRLALAKRHSNGKIFPNCFGAAYARALLGGFVLYLSGMYVIVADDHRYTSKDVVIAAFFFPYAWYAGGETVYRITTTSSREREFLERCLGCGEASRMPRKPRLRYCECLAERQSRNVCLARYLGKS